MSNAWVVSGKNAAALFTLKVHRGEGMALIAMNWKKGTPPLNFVGFAIEYKEPNGTQYFPLKKAPRVPKGRRHAQSECAVDAALADSEIPLGSLPTQRGFAR